MNERSLPSAADTEQLGAALAVCAPPPAGAALVVFLQGELGSGKTTLVRGWLRKLGITETVRSPTYTLVESYEAPQRRVVHIDLYRVADAAELDALGLRDDLADGVLLLVEWPERALASLPSADLRVSLSIAPAAGRIATVQADSPQGRAWLTELERNFQN